MGKTLFRKKKSPRTRTGEALFRVGFSIKVAEGRWGGGIKGVKEKKSFGLMIPPDNRSSSVALSQGRGKKLRNTGEEGGTSSRIKRACPDQGVSTLPQS